jgi:hypothetical protein
MVPKAGAGWGALFGSFWANSSEAAKGTKNQLQVKIGRATSLNLDGVVKSPIYCVVAGTANARRTTCTPAFGRHHHALYLELFT